LNILIFGSSIKGLHPEPVRLAIFLKKLGNEVTVIYSGKEMYSNLTSKLINEEIKLYKCDGLESLNLPNFLESTMKIYKLLKDKDDFDILHLEGITHIVKVFLALRKINKKPKTVVTINSFPRIGCRETNILGMLLSSVAYSMTDACIALCNHSKQQLIKWGISPNKIYVLPISAPALEWFDETKKNRMLLKQYHIEDINDPVVFYVARHIPIKGFEYYLLAASKVLKKFDATFIVGGHGPLTSALKRLAKKLKIDKNVIFTGLIHNLDMPAVLYNTADICVSTSLVEQLPTYIMECMAAGKPVVASSVGGIPEIVKDGVNGYLVPPCDYKETARRIMELLNEPEKAKKMGRAGRKMVEQKLNMKVSINKLMRIYEAICTT